ncbi:BTB/POZ domain-containing protein 17 [Ostrinia nubilalis]|uniref:BTB/POZ domain-containing protein 17 n=1 Tax=Ostrinia nubilalis TaxID=29057 RepID=UPI0030822A32
MMSYLTVDRQTPSSSTDKSGDASDNNDDLEVDNSKSVLLKIATLYAEQLMSDLVLEVAGVGYPVHRLILCASSEVFQVMLMNREWSEWRESRVVLQETPTAASVFPHFLKYFYTGQIRISHQTVLPVLSLADKYNVKDLVTLCLTYMSQHIAQAAKRGQLIAWMQYTMACGHNDVAKACQNFVKWNLEWVWSDAELAELDGETLLALLQQSDLVLHNEMSLYQSQSLLQQSDLVLHNEMSLYQSQSLLQQSDLVLHNEMSLYHAAPAERPRAAQRDEPLPMRFKALLQQSDLVLHNEMSLYHFVVRWLSKQRTRLDAQGLGEAEAKLHWDSLVAAVFSHVRFPMMCPNQLAKLLLCPLTQEHKEFFMERMAIAMSYQSGQYERVAEVQQSEAGRMLFTPRLYTEDTWGSVLGVDNFHSLACYHTRTFIFSTRSSMAEVCSERPAEWSVDLYPKGVWFRKSLLIVWAGTFDVPEVVLRTVRIAITCQNCPERAPDDWAGPEPDVRVKIGILVWGVQKGVEHVSSVVERVHRFSSQNRVLNIDGALDFDELNTPLYTPSASEATTTIEPPVTHKGPTRCPKCTDTSDDPEPRHLLGPNRDQLRIQVVIVPLTDYCHVGDAA